MWREVEKEAPVQDWSHMRGKCKLDMKVERK